MQALSDPAKDRAVRSIPPPPNKPLCSEQLFVSYEEVDWILLRDYLKR